MATLTSNHHGDITSVLVPKEPCPPATLKHRTGLIGGNRKGTMGVRAPDIFLGVRWPTGPGPDVGPSKGEPVEGDPTRVVYGFPPSVHGVGTASVAPPRVVTRFASSSVAVQDVCRSSVSRKPRSIRRLRHQ